LIIANIGTNWHSIEDCQRAIESAKRCGADAVKFTAFTFQSLYGLGKGHQPATYNKKYELPLEWLPQLRNKADQCSVELICAASDPEVLRPIDPYVNCHYVAAVDLNYTEMLHQVAKMRKPVLVATGGATEGGLTLAMSQLSGSQVALLYSVEATPAPWVNLFVLEHLRKICPVVGFADTTMDPIYVPLSAVKNHGASIIEKNFSCVGKDTPDGYSSLDEREFSAMTTFLLGKKQTSIGPLECERDMLLKHKRRLIATKEIKEGDRFVMGENFGAYKSLVADTAGLSPFMAKDINGHTARLKLDPGQPITGLHVTL
jgi:sialic acid synthase SpsE